MPATLLSRANFKFDLSSSNCVVSYAWQHVHQIWTFQDLLVLTYEPKCDIQTDGRSTVHNAAFQLESHISNWPTTSHVWFLVLSPFYDYCMFPVSDCQLDTVTFRYKFNPLPEGGTTGSGCHGNRFARTCYSVACNRLLRFALYWRYRARDTPLHCSNKTVDYYSVTLIVVISCMHCVRNNKATGILWLKYLNIKVY